MMRTPCFIRVKAAAPVVMVSSVFQGDDACEMAPGLRVGTNNMEISALIAPRPMILVSSSRDWTKNTPKEEYPAIHGLYELYGASSQLQFAQIDAKHNFNEQSRQAVYRFFSRFLAGEIFHGWKEPANLKLRRSELLVNPVRHAMEATAQSTVFASWRSLVRGGMEPWDARRWVSIAEDALDLHWPGSVASIHAGDIILLQRENTSERVPVRRLQGRPRQRNIPDTVVVVNERGSAQAMKEWPQDDPSGTEVLFVDVYQTGAAIAHRPTRRKDFSTFHRSDDANRVQDILTALAFAARTHGALHLACSPQATAWCMLAVALAPTQVTLNEDTQFQDGATFAQTPLFIPGLERLGGVSSMRQAIAWREKTNSLVQLAAAGL